MSEVKQHEASVSERFQRAHTYHTDLNENIIREVDALSDRVDRIESVLDQLRGAKNLLYFVGIGNLLILVTILYDTFIVH